MSKVIDPANLAVPLPEGSTGNDNWILDSDSARSSWILDGDGQPVPEPPAPPAAGAPAAPVAPPAPGSLPGQGHEFTTSTGHTFRGATPEDVLRQMEGAVIRSATLATSTQQELANARSTMAHQTAETRGGQRQEPPETFDPQKYYQLLADTKPMEAMDYAMKHYFNMENPREALDRSYSISMKVADRFEMADFISNNGDFPMENARASEALLLRVDQNMRNRGLDPQHTGISRWDLEVAKHQLYAERYVSPTSPALPAVSPSAGVAPSAAPTSRGAAAPPAPRRGSPANAGDRELSPYEFEMLTTAEQKAYLTKHKLI